MLDIVWFVVKTLLSLCINSLLIIMFVKAVMSWIAPTLDHPIMSFVSGVTELVVYPVRMLLMRFDFVRTFPLDLSFLATSIILVLLRTLLSSL